MNLLKFFTGGHRFRIKDFEHLQQANEQLFKYIGKTLYPNSDYTILQGCDLTITGGFFTAISEGLVYINGELIYVPAQTISISTSNEPCFFPVNTNSTLVIYKDGNSRNVHHVRVCNVADAAGVPLVDYFGFSLFKRLRSEAIVDFTGTNWQSAQIGWDTMCRRRFDTVTIDGLIKAVATPSTGSQVIFRLPEGFRPPRYLVFAVPEAAISYTPGMGVLMRRVTIETNGDVSIEETAGSLVTYIALSPIVFNV